LPEENSPPKNTLTEDVCIEQIHIEDGIFLKSQCLLREEKSTVVGLTGF
jgi:hypothetical protein